MDQPSETMWCRVSSSTCSLGPRRSRAARSSGPAARSKGRRASSRGQRGAASASRASGGQRAQVHHAAAGSARRGCDDLRRAAPSRAAKVVRSASWRRTSSSKARSQGRRRPAARPGAGRRGCCRRRCRARAGRGTTAAAGRRRAAACPSRGTGAERRHGRRRRLAVPARRLDARGEAGHGGRLEEGAQRQLDAEGGADARRRPGWPAASGRRARRSRRATPTRAHAQHLGPERRPAPPRSGVRGRDVARAGCAGRGVRGGQGLAVHLAVGGERQGRPARTKAEGTMYSGSRCLQEGAQRGRRPSGRPRRGTT